MAELRISVPIIDGPSGDQLCALFHYRDVKFKGKLLSFKIESSYLKKNPLKANVAFLTYKCNENEPEEKLSIIQIDSLAIAEVKTEGHLWKVKIIGKIGISLNFYAEASYSPRIRRGWLEFSEIVK